MFRISGVIITYNEEKNIGRCLASLQGVVDEIIVLDSYSKDRTEEISLSYGAVFKQHTFDGHIQQKNRAAGMANGDYILSLDADEALSDTLKASVLAIKRSESLYDAYSFNRLTNYCGKWIKHSSWYPDKKLRLWKKNIGSWGGRNPHDIFQVSRETKVKHLKGDLLHYSYYTIEEHVQQMDKFSTISANAYLEKGKKANLLLLIVNPSWRFIRDYFFKLGILDGFYGLIVCKNAAHEVFLKYAKLIHLKRNG